MLGPGSGGVEWCYVCVSPDSLCRWQVQIYVYCSCRIPAHVRCTQCQSCCTLWISASYSVFVCGRYRKCVVVGPGFVSTSPVFMMSSANHPAGPHGWFNKKNGKSGPHYWGREVSTQFVSAVTAPPLVCCVV